MSKATVLKQVSAVDRAYDRRMRRLLKARRKQMWNGLLDAFFLLKGMPLAFDTYKRTMAEADDDFTLLPASYSLTPRLALPGADYLCMAGHEVIQAQWFRKPIKKVDIELARYHCRHHSAVNAFPDQLFDRLMQEQPGASVRLPVTVWGFPGGMFFPVKKNMPKVPCVVYESKYGAAASLLEPAQCRYSTSMIQATLARQMKLATPHDAEFGMRAAPNEVMSIALLLWRYIGSGGTAKLTSNDQAEFMFPELCKAIGTMGHELMCCHQSLMKSLAQAEFEAMDNFVGKMKSGMLLTDLVDSETIGLINAMKVLAKHPEAVKAGIRLDSGDIPGQCVLYWKGIRYVLKIDPRTIVFENEVTHQMAKEVRDFFKSAFAAAGLDVNPDILFPGAGGYWWRVHRDMVSMAFKRNATAENGNVKFSNSPGKESLPGYLRVYGRNRTMIIGDVREALKDELLYTKLVDDGYYVYNESIQRQAQRAEETFGFYENVELSPMVADTLAQYVAKRESERAEAKDQIAHIMELIESGMAAEAAALLGQQG